MPTTGNATRFPFNKVPLYAVAVRCSSLVWPTGGNDDEIDTVYARLRPACPVVPEKSIVAVDAQAPTVVGALARRTTRTGSAGEGSTAYAPCPSVSSAWPGRALAWRNEPDIKATSSPGNMSACAPRTRRTARPPSSRLQRGDEPRWTSVLAATRCSHWTSPCAIASSWIAVVKLTRMDRPSSDRIAAATSGLWGYAGLNAGNIATWLTASLESMSLPRFTESICTM